MDRVALKVTQREAGGKGDAKKLRDQGSTPCVVYGDMGNDVISVNTLDFENILKHHRTIGSIVFNLEFNDSSKNRSAVIKEIQSHPLNGELLNVDFKEISMKEKIVSKVPLVTKGECKGVIAGGVLEQHMWDIHVSCLPTQIPDEYRVDITNLQIGDFLHISDLPKGGEIEIAEDDKELVLAVVAPRVAGEEDESSEDQPSEPEVTGQKKASEKDND